MNPNDLERGSGPPGVAGVHLLGECYRTINQREGLFGGATAVIIPGHKLDACPALDDRENDHQGIVAPAAPAVHDSIIERKGRQQICSNLKLPRHTSTLHL